MTLLFGCSENDTDCSEFKNNEELIKDEGDIEDFTKFLKMCYILAESLNAGVEVKTNFECYIIEENSNDTYMLQAHELESALKGVLLTERFAENMRYYGCVETLGHVRGVFSIDDAEKRQKLMNKAHIDCANILRR